MGQFWALNKEKLLLTLLHGHLTLEIYLYVEIEDDYKTCNNNIRLVHVYQGKFYMKLTIGNDQYNIRRLNVSEPTSNLQMTGRWYNVLITKHKNSMVFYIFFDKLHNIISNVLFKVNAKNLASNFYWMDSVRSLASCHC